MDNAQTLSLRDERDAWCRVPDAKPIAADAPFARVRHDKAEFERDAPPDGEQAHGAVDAEDGKAPVVGVDAGGEEAKLVAARSLRDGRPRRDVCSTVWVRLVDESHCLLGIKDVDDDVRESPRDVLLDVARRRVPVGETLGAQDLELRFVHGVDLPPRDARLPQVTRCESELHKAVGFVVLDGEEGLVPKVIGGIEEYRVVKIGVEDRRLDFLPPLGLDAGGKACVALAPSRAGGRVDGDNGSSIGVAYVFPRLTRVGDWTRPTRVGRARHRALRDEPEWEERQVVEAVVPAEIDEAVVLAVDLLCRVEHGEDVRIKHCRQRHVGAELRAVDQV
ncbi:hypothetical protein M885DRAFT_182542 [Pelagophyceae sp. CCMP2097]|nr:hypothetical protein M885DRAFT_182542 [Pelagophyceae sp. CCMP2097]